MRTALIPIAIATSILFLTPSSAEQTPAANLSAQVQSLVQTQMNAAVANAQSPEEAARIFMKLVSIGVSQVVADALPKSLSAAAASSAFTANKKIVGWEQYALAGLNLQWNWATPDVLPMSQYIAAVRTSGASPAGGDVHLTGVDITIGVGIHF
jgi:hypothetical protein